MRFPQPRPALYGARSSGFFGQSPARFRSVLSIPPTFFSCTSARDSRKKRTQHHREDRRNRRSPSPALPRPVRRSRSGCLIRNPREAVFGFPVACLEEGAGPCSRASFCRTLPLWKGLNQVVRDYLGHISVQDLVRQDPDGFDYVI